MSKTTATTFKTGDLAVYPSHGVGIIDGIKDRQIAGEDHSFYVLKILSSDATIMVPVTNVETVGLRKVMKKSMIPKVYSILQDKTDDTFENHTWNRRYREYTERIKTGCAMEVARVLRDLYMLKHGKELSFGERRMLDTAKTLLVKELSVARKVKEEKVEKELDELMQAEA